MPKSKFRNDRITIIQRGTSNQANAMENGHGDRFRYDAEGQMVEAWYDAPNPLSTGYGNARYELFNYDELWSRRGQSVILAQFGPTEAALAKDEFIRESKRHCEWRKSENHRLTPFLLLEMTLKELKIDEARAEIPESTATAIHGYWISLLSGARPFREPPPIISNKVILFVKGSQGKVQAGRLPADAYRHKHIHAAEEIIDDLIRICAEKGAKRESLLDRIEVKARKFSSVNDWKRQKGSE